MIETCSFSNQRVGNWGLFHQGDNTTGAGSGDDETIKINLSQAAKRGGVGVSLIVTVNVYSSGASFARSVRNAYVRLYASGNKELARYKLSDGAVTERGLIFAEMYHGKSGWQLTAIGKGCGGSTAMSSETKSAACNVRPAAAGWNENKHVSMASEPLTRQAPSRVAAQGGGCCVMQ